VIHYKFPIKLVIYIPQFPIHSSIMKPCMEKCYR
jgi:hypothetical protein